MMDLEDLNHVNKVNFLYFFRICFDIVCENVIQVANVALFLFFFLSVSLSALQDWSSSVSIALRVRR